MQGAEERRLRRMGNTPQGGTIEGNAALRLPVVIVVLYNRPLRAMSLSNGR